MYVQHREGSLISKKVGKETKRGEAIAVGERALACISADSKAVMSHIDLKSKNLKVLSMEREEIY